MKEDSANVPDYVLPYSRHVLMAYFYLYMLFGLLVKVLTSCFVAN